MGINKMQLILGSAPLTRQVSQGLDPTVMLFDLTILFCLRPHICSLQIFILPYRMIRNIIRLPIYVWHAEEKEEMEYTTVPIFQVYAFGCILLI